MLSMGDLILVSGHNIKKTFLFENFRILHQSFARRCPTPTPNARENISKGCTNMLYMEI